MNCPECGSATYDNRAENQKRAAEGQKLRPMFKCKSCEWVKWPPKEQKPQAPAGSNGKAAVMSLNDLMGLYDLCFSHATRVAAKAKQTDIPVTLDGVHAIAATIFIAATKNGAKAQPPKPKPQPQPEPEEEYYEESETVPF